jgi:hypothetical protein
MFMHVPRHSWSSNQNHGESSKFLKVHAYRVDGGQGGGALYLVMTQTA